MDEVKVAGLLGSVAGAVAGASGTVGWARTPPDHNPVGTALPRTDGTVEEEEEEERGRGEGGHRK